MEAYKHLMAKSDQEDDSLWLPLWMHLKDTAGVMKKLVHRWIPQSVVNASGLDFEEFEKTAVFTAAVHDIGKATSCFQSRIVIRKNMKRNELTDAGFTIRYPDDFNGKTPHSYAGQWILQSDTTGFGIDKTVCDIVGAHHGKPVSSSKINQEPDLLKVYETNFYGRENDSLSADVWKNAWREIVEEALKTAKLNSAGDFPRLSVQAQVILSGLLITADWIASNTEYFPLIDIDDTGSEALYPERITSGFEQLAFPEGWRSETVRINDKQFQERFGFLPNQVQRTMIEVVQECKRPGIFILEAQMGVGKTEAGLAAAELLASKDELGGVFFGLPTQSTSNGLFPRLYEWADSVSEDTVNSVCLAHGAAEFNDEYENLSQKILVDNEEEEDGGLEVHPWFQGNKKSLLADFVIGTVDQFLMASLRRKHFMLRHLGLAGKVVIIDECHAYDTYMDEYLDRSIQWMAAYGIPVILLSATLPEKRREKLIECYAKAYSKYNLGNRRPKCQTMNDGWEKNISYPLLTWTDGEEICQRAIDQDVKEKEIKIDTIGSPDEIILLLDESLKEGGCACVILNTVKEAQKVYQRILADMEDVEVLLYHAQFIMPDRAKKEKELLNHMGKNSRKSDRRRYILIGTQVLEQSLDYDADIMISQLCPMDLLLQRMGRLHRHDRERSEFLKNPRFVILMDGEKPYDDGSRAVYGDYLLQKTWQVISKKGDTEGNTCFSLPKEIPVLVQDVYSNENNKRISSYAFRPEETEKPESACADDKTSNLVKERLEYDEKQKAKKERAQRFLLKSPSGNIEGILENVDETIESAAESRVRDGISSISVILMIKETAGTITFVDKGERSVHLSPFTVPDDHTGRIIARQKMNMPHIFSQDWIIDRVIDELEKQNKQNLAAWQQSPWIRGELILLLDEDGYANLCGYQITYSEKMGLSYIREEENGRKGI